MTEGPIRLARPPAQAKRLAFLGTPDVAVPVLQALVEAGFEIPIVVSRPDRRRGRGSELSPSPVKAAAVELGLDTSDDLDDVLGAEVDLAVVVAYGRIVPVRILEQVPMVNLHFSLLPRWRGAAPVERALLAGDAVTGVCLMEIAEGLDTGAVYATATTPIGDDDTLQSLRGRLVAMGAEMVVAALNTGLAAPEPQTGDVVHAAKIDPSELEIDWSKDAIAISRLVRLGGAWTRFRGARLKVWSARVTEDARSRPAGELDGLRVATGDGELELIEVQPEGRARQNAEAWRNGSRPTPNEQLGQ
jgi:methionyl-tRNA formyltransferase